tara:strand:- start:144 stop:461 length:318 start_codon:yes stop_codon:yes gene_type:complete
MPDNKDESKLAKKLENATKVDQEHIDRIKEIQQKYVNVQTSLGHVSITRLRWKQQLNSLDELEDELQNKFLDTQKEEQTLLDELTKKYGDGTLDMDSGEFIPNKE